MATQTSKLSEGQEDTDDQFVSNVVLHLIGWECSEFTLDQSQSNCKILYYQVHQFPRHNHSHSISTHWRTNNKNIKGLYAMYTKA